MSISDRLFLTVGLEDGNVPPRRSSLCLCFLRWIGMSFRLDSFDSGPCLPISFPQAQGQDFISTRQRSGVEQSYAELQLYLRYLCDIPVTTVGQRSACLGLSDCDDAVTFLHLEPYFNVLISTHHHHGHKERTLTLIHSPLIHQNPSYLQDSIDAFHHISNNYEFGQKNR